jgi:cellulose synthase (UDP-forming)
MGHTSLGLRQAQRDAAQYSSPLAVESHSVFQWWDWCLYTLLALLSFGAIAHFLSFWVSLEDWLHYPVLFWFMSLMLCVSLVMNQFRWLVLPFMRKPVPIPPKPGRIVAVVTTFVPGAEPLPMLEETVGALTAMDYPHDTWVLDEGDDEHVKTLCHRLGANHFSRKNRARYQTAGGVFQSRTKHGNYNAWLHEIGFDRYEIVLGFDPDHVPVRVFLSTVIGYFEDPRVGYVQAAQAYYNQEASFIARGAAEETYGYYSSLQMVNHRMGFPIVVGCHNTHRVSALKEVGGFAPHDADDLLITLLYRTHGWRGVYVPQVLARGLTPVDWNGYLSQQLRWARSVLDIKFRIYPRLAKRLPLRERLFSFLQGLSYLQGAVTATGVALLLFMLTTGITPAAVSLVTISQLGMLYAALLLCDLYRQRFYLDPRSEAGLHWRAGLLQLAKWPYLLVALYDVILDRRVPYRLTSKVRSKRRQDWLLWPQLLVLCTVGGAWISTTTRHGSLEPVLHLAAAIVVAGAVILIVTGFLDFPDPYDGSLRRK